MCVKIIDILITASYQTLHVALKLWRHLCCNFIPIVISSFITLNGASFLKERSEHIVVILNC